MEFNIGDRIRKNSGVCSGKSGTVKSILTDGTLAVNFDGEKINRYCDPTKCETCNITPPTARKVIHDGVACNGIYDKLCVAGSDADSPWNTNDPMRNKRWLERYGRFYVKYVDAPEVVDLAKKLGVRINAIASTSNVQTEQARNTKFKVGDKVKVIGKGLASKGWIGRIGKIISGRKEYNNVVEFPSGKYSNDDGEYSDYELALVNADAPGGEFKVTNAGDGKVEVTLECVSFDGVRNVTRTLSTSQLKDLFSKFHLGNAYQACMLKLASEGEYYTNIDISPKISVALY